MSLTGSRIGPYEIVSPLGAGGMGEVYRARDTKLGRDVAIKILPPAFTADPDRRARFEREARVLASLNHPHIGAIYGFEDAGGVHALVLELVEGETLDARLRSRGSGLGIRESLVIGRQISYALDAAHERGIVHRDLKPANIVITPEGVVKVLDFGLAKAGQAGGAGGAGWEEGLTHSPTAIGPTIDGVLLGTAPYMSPEQARGKAVDKRTDIWAFGCVLYEMLTGRRAFGGETTSDTIAAVLEREPDWSIVPPATPAHVVRLLKRSLDKDPKTRLRDIGDARADLEEARTATDAGAVRQTPARRSIIVAWVAFAVMTAAAGALAIVAGRPAAPSSEIRFETTVPPEIPSNFAQLAVSPDGQQLAVAPAFDGRAPLWLRPLDSIAGRSLPGTEGAIFPFWSPDGRSVAFFADRKLKRITLESEAVEIVADAVIARGGTWKSDGTILYAPNLTSPIFRVPASGGHQWN